MEDQRKRAECILVVDGEVLVRHAISEYMRDCGYRVIEASNSDEAMAAISQGDLPIGAVLCDAQIQGSMNGFELKRWVRETLPNMEVILAGNIEAAVHAAADICEEGPHLQRPYDPQGIVDHIKRVLGRKDAS